MPCRWSRADIEEAHHTQQAGNQLKSKQSITRALRRFMMYMQVTIMWTHLIGVQQSKTMRVVVGKPQNDNFLWEEV
jgi:hypothetical protein